jgi:LPXTG-motif cell wall-anchored protein
MAGDHALEARVDRMKADIRARRKEADKRSIAAVAGTAALVGAAAWYLVRRRSRDE